MRKKIFIITLCLCMLCSICALAETRDFVNENGNWADIQDDASIFINETEILDVMKYVTEYTNAFCYTTDYNPGSTESLARSLADDEFGSGNGVVFLIDMDERYVYIYAHNDTYDVITSLVADTITDNAYNYASRKDYDGCAEEVFSQIYHKLSGKRIPEPMRYIGNIFLAIMFGIGIAAVWACYSSRIGITGKTIKDVNVKITDKQRDIINTRRVLRTSSSGGGSSGGGSHSGGGGGGGGGSHGGGGGHRF